MITTIVTGVRADLAPRPIPEPFFTYQCRSCTMDTLTETEYPDYLPIYCNVCSEHISAEVEQDPNTRLVLDMPIEAKCRLIDEAQRLRIPVEVAFQRFIESRYGRPIHGTYANTNYSSTEAMKAEKKAASINFCKSVSR